MKFKVGEVVRVLREKDYHGFTKGLSVTIKDYFHSNKTVIYRCANSFGIEFDLKEVDITKKGYKNL
jgi:hypothetical protein